MNAQASRNEDMTHVVSLDDPSPCRSGETGKRALDILFAILAIGVFALPMLMIAWLVKLTSAGPVLYWSDRVGRNNQIFRMPKFRTMALNAPQVAAHHTESPAQYVTTVGRLLRRFSLDELPQIYSILRGQMSFVGPRPVLHVEDDLVGLRAAKGVHRLMPGLTGWAQINGRASIPIALKVMYDEYYLKNRSLPLDLKILWVTLFKVLRAEDIHH